MTPSVSLQELYNDNFLLTSGPEPAVTGTVITPGIDLSAKQDAWSLDGTAKWQNSHYSGQSGLDTNDQYLNLLSNYNTPRNTWGLTGTYAKESILTSTTAAADIGLAHTQIQRITRSIDPTWTWTMDEKTQLQVSYQYNGVTYSEGSAAGLYNYNQNVGGVTLSNQISARTQIFGVLQYSRFYVPVLQIPGTTETSDTSTAEIGVSHNFSSTFTGSLAAGEQYTRTSETQCDPFFLSLFGQCFVTPSSSKDTGAIYSASLQKQFERSTVNLTLSRNVSPSGAGTQVLIDSGSLSDNWQISPRLLGLISANVYTFRAVGTSVTELNRNYYSPAVELRWLWTQNLKISALYQYIWEKDIVAGGLPAHSNSIYLTLNYSWPYLSVSR